MHGPRGGFQDLLPFKFLGALLGRRVPGFFIWGRDLIYRRPNGLAGEGARDPNAREWTAVT